MSEWSLSAFERQALMGLERREPSAPGNDHQTAMAGLDKRDAKAAIDRHTAAVMQMDRRETMAGMERHMSLAGLNRHAAMADDRQMSLAGLDRHAAMTDNRQMALAGLDRHAALVDDRQMSLAGLERHASMADDRQMSLAGLDRHASFADDRQMSLAGVDRHDALAAMVGAGRHATLADVDRHSTLAGMSRHASLADMDRHAALAGMDRYTAMTGMNYQHSPAAAGVNRGMSLAGMNRHMNLSGMDSLTSQPPDVARLEALIDARRHAAAMERRDTLPASSTNRYPGLAGPDRQEAAILDQMNGHEYPSHLPPMDVDRHASQAGGVMERQPPMPVENGQENVLAPPTDNRYTTAITNINSPTAELPVGLDHSQLGSGAADRPDEETADTETTSDHPGVDPSPEDIATAEKKPVEEPLVNQPAAGSDGEASNLGDGPPQKPPGTEHGEDNGAATVRKDDPEEPVEDPQAFLNVELGKKMLKYKHAIMYVL